jgi:ribosomal protein S6 kinase alpha-5
LQAKFYAAEVTLALEFLHELGVIYRDMKLENILLDAEGHVLLTDFGLSKEMMHEGEDGERTFSFVGTNEYLAPEVIEEGKGHTKAVDWWALGILLYELVWGRTPFVCVPETDDLKKDNMVVLDNILKDKKAVPPVSKDRKGYTRTEEWSDELCALINQLLMKEPKDRLGYGPEDGQAIRTHPFFKGTDWTDVRTKRTPPPFLPVFEGEDETKYFDGEFTEQVPEISPGMPGMAGSKNLFRGFSFVAPAVLYGTNLFRPGDTKDNDADLNAFMAKYKLSDAIIGDGAFSVCKRATNNATGEEYACKIISNAKCEKRMVEMEIEMLQKMQKHGRHPNIISLEDFLIGTHHTYLLMPLCSGGELLERIKSQTKFTEMEASRIFKKLIGAVVFLHKNGIVHRDLKSENLLYVSQAADSDIKIVDFGFAKEIGSLADRLKTPCFTDTHAAPEVLENYHAQLTAATGMPTTITEEGVPLRAPLLTANFGQVGGQSSLALGYDASCDFWSLGVVLYTMLCGYGVPCLR